MEREKIKEGKTELIVPKKRKISKKAPVFFNEKKALDRTISVLFSKAFFGGEKVKICDLLAGTGARAFRILNEGPESVRAYLNDANPKAVKLIKKNAENLGLTERVKVFNKEAREFLYSTSEVFNYIDIDPFGSPLPFLKAAISRLNFTKGVLSVTATDLATLMGAYPKTCFRRYQAKVEKVPYSRELGLRILVKKVIEVAAEKDLALKPVFSNYRRHYYRSYLKLEGEGAKVSNKVLEEIGFLKHCPECQFRGKYKLGEDLSCPLCDSETKILGPLWLGKLSSKSLVEKMLKFKHLDILKRILGEIKVGIPFYYHLPSISQKLDKNTPAVETVLEKVGGSRTHFDPEGIKTKKNIKKVKEAFS